MASISANWPTSRHETKGAEAVRERRILPASRRTAAGYRVYDGEALALLAFIRRARALGFTLGEIKEIVAIKREGARRVRTCAVSSAASSRSWIASVRVYAAC